MQRFNRLKWIPMIVKAYSEARVQTELALRNQGSETDSASRSKELSTKAEKAVPVRVKRRPSKEKLSRTTETAQRSAQRVKQLPTGRVLTRKSANSTADWQRQHTDGYKSVLAELRETKRKLNRLESIHDQLTQMQQQLDEKLQNLFQRLDDTTGERESEKSEQKTFS